MTEFKKGHNKGVVAWNKGHKLSDETKEKIRKNNAKYWSEKERTEETRKKLRDANLGSKLSEDTKKKISLGNLGKRRTEETRRRISKSISGEKNHGWKGGIESENRRIRKGVEFRLWREAVFARDNWTCQKTGIKGGKLHPHHIKNFAQFPELRFAIDNGITLSDETHKTFHKEYGLENNTKEQLDKFLGT